MPSTVAHAEPSDSMLHGNTCEVRDGDRPHSRFVERARERNGPVRKTHYRWFVVGVALVRPVMGNGTSGVANCNPLSSPQPWRLPSASSKQNGPFWDHLWRRRPKVKSQNAIERRH